MRFRKVFIFALAVWTPAVLPALAQDSGKPWPPSAYPESRYEKTWSRNPFNLKTVTVVENRASFAANLAIAGISVVGDETAVILIDRNSRKYQRVTAKPNAAGISLISVSQEAGLTESVAEIEKNGEKAVVRYEAGALAKRPGNRSKPSRPGPGDNASGKANQSNGRGQSEKSDGR